MRSLTKNEGIVGKLQPPPQGIWDPERQKNEEKIERTSPNRLILTTTKINIGNVLEKKKAAPPSRRAVWNKITALWKRLS